MRLEESPRLKDFSKDFLPTTRQVNWRVMEERVEPTPLGDDHHERHGHAADHKDIWQASDIAISARAAKRHWVRLAARDWGVCAN